MYEEPQTVEEMLARYKAIKQRTNPTPAPIINTRAMQPKPPKARRFRGKGKNVKEAPKPVVKVAPKPVVKAPPKPTPRVYVLWSDDGVPYFRAEPGSPVINQTKTIMHSVCRDWGITPDELCGAGRPSHLVKARRQFVYTLAAFGVRVGPHRSLKQMGITLGRDHTTIIWNLRQATKDLFTDEFVRHRYRITLDAVQKNHEAICKMFSSIMTYKGGIDV